MTNVDRNKSRFSALDGLRGIAALAVVFYHVKFPNHFTAYSGRLFKNGYMAVDLFFILSGFVIYANYSGKIYNTASALRFIVLRFFRIYPLHLAILFVFVCAKFTKLLMQSAGIITVDHEPFTEPDTYEALAINVLLIQGLFRPLTWNFPSWSISCEFVAYLLFSAAVLAGMRRRKGFFAIGAVMAIAAYCGLALTQGTLDLPYWGLVRCLPGFLFGMLIFEFAVGAGGRLLSAQPTMFIASSEITIVIGITLTMWFVSGAASLSIMPIFMIAVAVLQLDRGPIARFLMWPEVQFLGRISYSIYMTHAFVLLSLAGCVKHALVPFQINMWIGDGLILAAVLVVLAVSFVTYTFIEEPARSYGRRLFAVPTGTV